jgi:tetratricopeptide (TPR) repeat protein
MNAMLDTRDAIARNIEFNLKAIRREIADYERIESPAAADRLRLQALVCYYGRHYPQALKLLNALVATAPEQRSQTKLAQVLVRLGRYEEARAVAEQVIGEYPDAGLAHEMLGTALIGLGNYAAAAAALDRAASLITNPRLEVLQRMAQSSSQLPAPSGNDVTDLVDLASSGDGLTQRGVRSAAVENHDVALILPCEG